MNSGPYLLAYIDPGFWSQAVQILIAGIVGAAFAVGVFWRNVKSFFSRLFGRKDASKGDDDTA